MKKLASALVLLLAASSLVGCKKVIKHQELEKVIKEQLKTNVGWEASITCPANQEFKAGSTFDCDGKATDGKVAEKPIVVTVTQKDDKGNVAFNLKSVDGKPAAEYFAASDPAHAAAAAPAEAHTDEE